MTLKIIDVDYLKDYQLLLTFNSGEIKKVDLKDKLESELFEPLKDITLFKQYGLLNGNIEWINGADFAQEYLYEIGKKINTQHNKKCNRSQFKIS
jgi:hypothetical protein